MTDHIGRIQASDTFLDTECRCLFFRTPRATLYHLVAADRLWLHRLSGTWKTNLEYKSLCAYWLAKADLVKDSRLHSLQIHNKEMYVNINRLKQIVAAHG